ncbi:NHL repeat containing protein [uncultured Stenotrophomonas sp.]|uniref:NHL repeat containing protein n=1 Tax=uncultured Stenotrophomonas sp. TaxID=165438 RepID=A0A1Y5Q0G1_9GAMM|nr:NHL repeat containing protein [uncultured Stenotrophomonas sp.]
MTPRCSFRLLPVLLLLPLVACSVTPAVADREPDQYDADDVLLRDHEVPHVVVREAFVTAATPAENIDSPASWLQDGKRMLVATAKATDALVVYDGDSGRRLRTLGGPGKALGQLQRPNGVATIDDRYLFVVERDNRRVQMFALPEFTPLLAFGGDALQQPYGLWVRAKDEGYEVLVSDAYMAGEDANGDDVVPPLEQLDRRFRRYAVVRDGDGWKARDAGSFGDTSAAGAIRVPESLFGDEAHGRLLVAEEDVPTGTRLREYDLQGRYLGRDVGVGQYKAQAEGIALMACADGGGWWVASDQFADRTVFHLFDRTSLAHAGSFAGEVTGLTDGVWLDARGDARFPQGVFYASHLDQGVAAFDWRDIAAALKLPECAQP